MEQRRALAASELLRLVRSGRVAPRPPYSRLVPSPKAIALDPTFAMVLYMLDGGDETLRALHLSRLLRFLHVLSEDDETVEDVYA